MWCRSHHRQYATVTKVLLQSCGKGGPSKSMCMASKSSLVRQSKQILAQPSAATANGAAAAAGAGGAGGGGLVCAAAPGWTSPQHPTPATFAGGTEVGQTHLQDRALGTIARSW
jgi:hypothetical protein